MRREEVHRSKTDCSSERVRPTNPLTRQAHRRQVESRATNTAPQGILHREPLLRRRETVGTLWGMGHGRIDVLMLGQSSQRDPFLKLHERLRLLLRRRKGRRSDRWRCLDASATNKDVGNGRVVLVHQMFKVGSIENDQIALFPNLDRAAVLLAAQCCSRVDR
jgi:hypothetical protein